MNVIVVHATYIYLHRICLRRVHVNVMYAFVSVCLYDTCLNVDMCAQIYVNTYIQELFVPRPSATAPAFDLVCVVLVQITSF